MAYTDWLADPRSAPYRQTIFDAAQRTGQDPGILAQQIGAESSFNPFAVSSTGARGIAQILPSTARDPGYGVSPIANPFDPTAAINFQADYLKARGGTTPEGLAAYSGGDYNSPTTQNILRGSDSYNAGQVPNGVTAGTTSVAGDGSMSVNEPSDPNALFIRVRPNNQPMPTDPNSGAGSGASGVGGSSPGGLSGLLGIGAASSTPAAIVYLSGKTKETGAALGGDVKSSSKQLGGDVTKSASTLAGAAKTASVDAGGIAAGVQTFAGDIFVRGAIVVLALIFVAFGLAYFGRGGSVDPGAIGRAAKNPVRSVKNVVKATSAAAKGTAKKAATTAARVII